MRYLFDRLCNPSNSVFVDEFRDCQTLVLHEIAQAVERICSQRSAFLWGVPPSSQALGALGFGVNLGIGRFDDRAALRVKCSEIQRAISLGEPRLKKVIVEANKSQTVGKLSITIQGIAMVNGEAFDFDRDVNLRIWR